VHWIRICTGIGARPFGKTRGKKTFKKPEFAVSAPVKKLGIDYRTNKISKKKSLSTGTGTVVVYRLTVKLGP
jgi:hypothetical protein